MAKRRLTKSGYVDKRVKVTPEVEARDVRNLVEWMVRNRSGDMKMASKELKIPYERIRGYRRRNAFLDEVKRAGSERVMELIPKALMGLEDSLGAKSEEVKLKASLKLLESEGIMGGQRIDVYKHEERPIGEIVEDLKRAGLKVPERTVIDAEVAE